MVERRSSSKSRRIDNLAWYDGQVAKITRREQTDTIFPWRVIDSALDTGKHSFEEWFACVLPPGESSLRSYIETTLQEQKGRRALELGGTGSKLFAGFTPHFFEQTAGVNLTDFRMKSLKREDTKRNHTVIPGNIFEDATKQEVEKVFDGEKLSLIMTRMLGGSEKLPKEPFFIGKQASYWYEQLAPGGLLFAQVPEVFRGKLIREWRDHMNAAYADTLVIQLADTPGRSVLRLQKLPGAPEELPLIGAQQTLKLVRK